DHAAGAADVLDHDVRLSGNVRGQMLSNDASLAVGRAARRVVDDHGDGLALVELSLRAACESKRRERGRRDQSYSGHGLAPPVRAFAWRIREPRTRSAPSPVYGGGVG